ncbi:hypothetical protein BCR44DRAFT_32521 [Catenaria anguillulae PL171]|uniref:Uncharacterized protein n=1 Tax=Catenaria anguillulae PL171 TaxID=765915 RepID=A0A1Y2H5X9_9FUNG|nr:hypothetical protein BCR44DRAFT_32521 [Catenaria anguillulae PL171]
MAAVTLDKPPSSGEKDAPAATSSSSPVAKESVLSEEMRESLKEKTAPSSPVVLAISDAPKIDSVLDLNAEDAVMAEGALVEDAAVVATDHEVAEVNVVAPSAGETGSFSHVDHSDEEEHDVTQSEVEGVQTESDESDAAQVQQDAVADVTEDPQSQLNQDEEDDASETIKVTPQQFSSVSLNSRLKMPCTRSLRVGLGVGADDDGDMVAFLAINNLLRGPHRVSVMKMTDDTMYRPLVLGARNVQLYYGIGKDHKLPLVVGKFMFKEQAKIWGINLDLI